MPPLTDLEPIPDNPNWFYSIIEDFVSASIGAIDVLLADHSAPPGERTGATGNGTTELSPTRHSPDFRSAHWYGDDYAFTGNQAAVVKILWEAWKNGTPEVSDAHLLTKAESDCKRLADVFRDARTGKHHDAWDKMIVSGTTKGTRRLNPPQKLNIDPKST